MPVRELDRSAALVVIDLQKGIVAMPTVHPASQIVEHTARLARAFRQRGLPVVLVHVTGSIPRRSDAPLASASRPSNWADFVPELDLQPDDILIEKRTWGAFIGTSLDEQLRRRGVTQIFLTGIATSMGVESTARSAFDYGYHIAFVSDAITDRIPESHVHTIEKIFPRMGQMTTTDETIRLLSTSGSEMKTD